MMVTKKGQIKQTILKDFSRPMKSGIRAINLKDKDSLVTARLSTDALNFVLCTKNGMAVKFDGKDVRRMGRATAGVRAIRLKKGDEVIGLEVAKKDASLFTITENGYGKRTKTDAYRLIRRGGKGVRNIITSERNGLVVGVKTVMEHDELLVTSANGIVIRIPASGVSVIGRNTQGVRVMKLKKGDRVMCVARVIGQKNGTEDKNDK
jgi:DNA gyrase subunit A